MVLKFANTGLWKDTGGLLLLICLLLAVGSLQLAPAEGVMCLYAVSHNILRVMSQQCRFSQWMASPGTSSCQSSGTWVASSKEQYLPKDSSSNTPHVSHEARHLPMGDSLALPLKCLLSKFWNTFSWLRFSVSQRTVFWWVSLLWHLPADGLFEHPRGCLFSESIQHLSKLLHHTVRHGCVLKSKVQP